MSDTGLDPDDLRMLQTLLRDEAHESLEHVAGILLAAPDGGPGEHDVDELLRQTHSLKGAAGTVGLASIAKAAHALEEQFAMLRAKTGAWSGARRDALVAAVDALRTLVDREINGGADPALAPPARPPQNESSDDQISGLAKEPVAVADRRAGERRVTTTDRRAGGQLSRSERRQGRGSRAAADSESPIARGEGHPTIDRRGADLEILRIAAGRIDQLMDTVGELGITRTRLLRHARSLSEAAEKLAPANEAITALAAAITEDADTLQQSLDALFDGLARTRMMPFRSLYRQLALQVRQLCRDAGTRAELVTSGEDIEIDKVVAARVADPLIQLLRNAIAHGIEPPKVRLQAKKPAHGIITISARHEGRQVAIELSDDGAGIDPAALRARLVAAGHLTEARARLATDDQVVGTIFEPGVTSRERADELSGRGVGLDVVRATIAKLGGEISVRSTPGAGTTFSIQLPVTAALAKALLFKAGGEVMAVPDAHVVCVAEIPATRPLPETIAAEGESVPLLDLHAALSIARPSSEKLGAVVIDYAGRRLGFSCDRVVGPREIVVKALGPLLAPLALFAGGTVSGSGKVQLLLDPAALVALAFSGEAASDGAASGRRVLVADDSLTARAGVARVLTRAGFSVDTAEDGGRAWDLLARKTYDAVVTDIDMPRLSGLELLAKIRQTAKLVALPVIVISASATPEAESRAKDLGARAIFAKPVAAPRLLAALTDAR